MLNGPNFWSVRKHQLVVLKLDLEELEEIPTHKIPGFYQRLQKNLPSLYNHYCSEGVPGGLFERVKNGTWMGHVLEHIALEIQTQAGMHCGFGRTRQAGTLKGIYNVVFECHNEKAGLFAAESAFKITEAIIYDKPYNVLEDIERLKFLGAEYGLGPSTSSIVNAALDRGIPVIRLDQATLVQLGYGFRQKLINATVTNNTSCIAVDIAGDKFLTKSLLKNAAIPVSEGVLVERDVDLNEAVASVSYPLVIKPYNSNHGKGVTTNIKTNGEAHVAYNHAKKYSDKVIVEKYHQGDDYRFLVIDYKLSAVARRTPAKIKGDGQNTVRFLVEKANRSPLRGFGHEKVLTQIKIDEQTVESLKEQGYTLDSVPVSGKTVFLKQTANLSTGGTSEDVTDFVHPDIVAIAERVAITIGLDICGIDMVLDDICKPFKNNGVVIEVNAAPGFRMHTNPFKGKSRNVGEDVVNMLFPQKSNGRIPLVAITGTNGKTTTARILAHIARIAGYHVGLTTTEGIYINNSIIEEGDCTGPISASRVLRNKTVEFAVLECARGGILRSGLAFDLCDVGIVTNVAEDHIGLKDIETVDDMAKVKAIVPESVKKEGYAVLNADNDYTFQMVNRLKCNVALFSTNPLSERILQHCDNGGLAAVPEHGNIVLVKGKKKLLIEAIENIPVAFRGKAPFMLENILAATLAAYVENISVLNISQALQTFTPSVELTPGRLNIFEFRKFRLMIDYAHNYHGIKALGSFLNTIDASVKVGIISIAGDRRDIDIINVGSASAEIFDKIIIRLDEDKRGRKENEIISLLIEGLRKVKPDISVEIIPDELEAIYQAVRNAKEGYLIVNLSEKVKNSIGFVRHLLEDESFHEEYDFEKTRTEDAREPSIQYESAVD